MITIGARTKSTKKSRRGSNARKMSAGPRGNVNQNLRPFSAPKGFISGN